MCGPSSTKILSCAIWLLSLIKCEMPVIGRWIFIWKEGRKWKRGRGDQKNQWLHSLLKDSMADIQSLRLDWSLQKMWVWNGSQMFQGSRCHIYLFSRNSTATWKGEGQSICLSWLQTKWMPSNKTFCSIRSYMNGNGLALRQLEHSSMCFVPEQEQSLLVL